MDAFYIFPANMTREEIFSCLGQWPRTEDGLCPQNLTPASHYLQHSDLFSKLKDTH